MTAAIHQSPTIHRMIRHAIIGGLVLAAFTAGSAVTARLTRAAQATADLKRVFELDVYHVVPGKVAALEARFRNATPLFAKHHLQAVGYWIPEGTSAWANTFVYLIAHRSIEDAKNNWAEFHADPAFQKDLKAEEAEKLIETVDETYMRPTSFSRLH